MSQVSAQSFAPCYYRSVFLSVLSKPFRNDARRPTTSKSQRRSDSVCSQHLNSGTDLPSINSDHTDQKGLAQLTCAGPRHFEATLAAALALGCSLDSTAVSTLSFSPSLCSVVLSRPHPDSFYSVEPIFFIFFSSSHLACLGFYCIFIIIFRLYCSCLVLAPGVSYIDSSLLPSLRLAFP